MAASFSSLIICRTGSYTPPSSVPRMFLEIIQRAIPKAAEASHRGPISFGYAINRPVGTTMAVLTGTPAMSASPRRLITRTVAALC